MASAALVLTPLAAGRARAAEKLEIGACPSRSTVAAAARALLGRSDVDLASIETEIEVIDAGPRFMVSLRGRSREYADETRDCKERTRTAAIFVALTLAPPDVGVSGAASSEGEAQNSDANVASHSVPSAEEAANATPSEPTAVPVPVTDSAATTKPKPQVDRLGTRRLSKLALRSPEPARAPPARPSARAVAVELGVLAALAPRSDTAQIVGGAELRAALTFDRVGMSAGLSLPSPSTLTLAGARVKEERASADASLRLLWQGARLSGAFDLGLLAALYRLTRDGATAVGQRRVELGLRAAANVELLPGAVTPFLRVFTEVVPVTRKIAVEPRGVVGHTPPLWLGATLGISGKFR